MKALLIAVFAIALTVTLAGCREHDSRWRRSDRVSSYDRNDRRDDRGGSRDWDRRGFDDDRFRSKDRRDRD